MRYTFICMNCGTHYLPPETMRYPTGVASPLHCTVCLRVPEDRRQPVPPGAEAIAMLNARRQARTRAAVLAAGTTGTARTDARPSRPPLTGRPRRPLRGGRTRLN